MRTDRQSLPTVKPPKGELGTRAYIILRDENGRHRASMTVYGIAADEVERQIRDLFSQPAKRRRKAC